MVDIIEKVFYIAFNGPFGCSEIPVNKKAYTSYFISFGEGLARIELMHRPDIVDFPAKKGFTKGLAHLSIAVGSKTAVDELTERLRAGNYTIEGEPRTTGDGYYESVVLDPEDNYIEITA